MFDDKRQDKDHSDEESVHSDVTQTVHLKLAASKAATKNVQNLPELV